MESFFANNILTIHVFCMIAMVIAIVIWLIAVIWLFTFSK